MKNSILYLFFLTVLKFCLISCVNISTPTNYTLSILSNIKEDIERCENDNDCSFGKECISVDIDNCPSGKVCKGCSFTQFLCLENESKPCLFFNSTLYSQGSEEIVYKYKKEITSEEKKPILKTCDKTQVENKKCKTDKCENDNDCLSGSCYSNNCVTGASDIHLCTGTIHEGKSVLHCGKQAQMKCSVNNECYSNNCNEGFCQNNDDAPVDVQNNIIKRLISIFIIIALIIVLLTLLCYCLGKKNEKKN